MDVFKLILKKMKIKIVKNKYLNALILLVLFSAIIHTMILFLLAISSFDIYVLNYFNILDVDILFPGIFFNSVLSNISSLIFIFAVYLIILVKNENK